MNHVLKKTQETGWGMALNEIVNIYASVQNNAVNGRSSKSFLIEGCWMSVYNKIRPSDFVIIQFGHNDAKTDTLRHTEPYTTYKQNLEKYISDTRAKGVNSIICSSIVRRHFDKNANLINTHGDYIKAAC